MILCVGLTPTIQRTMRFDRFSLNTVNRAKETLTTASGKGVNVARVATLLGAPARLIQIVGGDSGRWLAKRLEADGVPCLNVWADDDAPTRTCTTLLHGSEGSGGGITELVEEAAPVEPHDVSLLRAAIRTALLEAKIVCLSGSLPPHVSADFYAGIVRDARELGVPCLVDAQKEPLARALTEHPLLVKPNREEAAATLGLSLTGDPYTDARAAVVALTKAGAQWALVSMGGDGSLLGNGRQLWRIRPPRVAVVNAIGSGDSLAAGIAVAHVVRGRPIPDAAAFGTACGAANCLSPTSGVLDPREVERLLPEVVLEPC